MVEVRFLVPPALVEAARQAMAPFAIASLLDERREEKTPCVPPARAFRSAEVTRKELEVLLRG